MVRPSGPQASFLEPPAFDRHNFGRYNDEWSEKSAEDDQVSHDGDDGRRRTNLRPLWKTAYMDDDDEDETFGLHFADETKDGRSQSLVLNAHGERLANLAVRIIPRSNDPVE